MTELNQKRILGIGALGAGLSTIMLILMAFITFPAGIEYPGLEVLTRDLTLSPIELEHYLNSIHFLYIIDGFFLLGWLLSWIGVAQIVRSHSSIFSTFTLIFGIAGALFDFGENSIIWGALQTLQSGLIPNNNWVIVWKAVQHFSYWLPFIGAVFAACGLWGKRPLDRITALVGSLLVIPAVVGLYIPGLSLLPNLWFLFWFVSVGLLLRQRAVEIIPSSNPS